MCQALAERPQSKYQNEGGPGPEQIADLLRDHSDRPAEDVQTFADALIFNWLIAGSDGHSKNYSLLHAPGGRIRLAPLYDIASALPYSSMHTPRLKLAMKYGGQYRLQRIGSGELGKLAKGIGLPADALLDRAADMAAQMPAHAKAVYNESREQGLERPVIGKLVKALRERAKHCGTRLGR